MALPLPGYPLEDTSMKDATSESIEMQCPRSKWYFSKQELECNSPSRKDGINLEMESKLRKLYCSYLQELGMKLKVPQVTIATSMMMCHRFYMRQSHAKNNWQTVATACMFCACKSQETPCWLNDVTIVAYKLMYKWDPSAPQRIKQKDVYEKQKELILVGERLLLSTIAFDLNIDLPYKPLVSALMRMEFTNKKLVARVAWNFVNDWLHTTICLQYKPHYVAAASIYLASRNEKAELPMERESTWWMQFDVAPRQLKETIREIHRFLKEEEERARPPTLRKAVDSKVATSKSVPNDPPPTLRKVVEPKNEASKSAPNGDSHSPMISKLEPKNLVSKSVSNFPESLIKCSSNLNQSMGHGSTAKSDQSSHSCIVDGSCVDLGATSDIGISITKFAPSSSSDCGSANSVIVDGELKPKDTKPCLKIVSIEVGNSKIDVTRIKEALKRKRQEKSVNMKKIMKVSDDEIDSEAWIERELEMV